MKKVLPLAVIVALAWAVYARAGGPFYDLVVRYHVGDPEVTNPVDGSEGPKHLAVADFDLDGSPDLACANLDGSVSVLLGQGDDEFEDQILFTIPGATFRGITAADLDGDDLPDVAVADPLNGAVHLLKGGGDGSFIARTSIGLGPGCRAVEAADLNGDGVVDLASVAWDRWPTSGPEPDRLVVLLSQGGGHFTPRAFPIPVSQASEPFHLVIGDFNGDGNPDVATANRVSSNVTVFAGDGAGNFTLTQVLATGGTGSRYLAVGFLDEAAPGGVLPGDARPDLVVANRDSQNVALFLGTADGFFEEEPICLGIGDGPRSVALADLDDDGWQDLIVVNRYGNRISVLRGLGDARFDFPRGFPVGTSPRHIVVSDFNGDGAEDVAVANRYSQDISVLSGASGTMGFLISDSFYLAGSSPVAVTIADLNRDGKGDLVAVNRYSHDITVRLTQEDGLPGPPVFYDAGYQPQALDVGDLDGNGTPDVVVAGLGAQQAQQIGYGGSVVVLLGDEEGRLRPGPSVFSSAMDFRPFSIKIGELSTDQIPDLAVGTFAGRVLFFRGLGGGAFEEHAVREGFDLTIPGARALALSDLDGDGDEDLVAAGLDIPHFAIIPMEGDVFAKTKLEILQVNQDGKTAHAVAVSDLDGDGHKDVVLAMSRGHLDVHYGNGNMVPSERMKIPVPGEPVSVAAADYNGDGVIDIAAGNRTSGEVLVFAGTGGRDFELLQGVRVYSPEGIVQGDINGDGRIDIAGVGTGIWVLINGRKSGLRPMDLSEIIITGEPGLYINEVMSRNRSFYPDESGDRESWIEIFNSYQDPRSLEGYHLAWTPQGGEKAFWTVSYPAPLSAEGHVVIFADGESQEGPFHASFKLTPDGGHLELLDPNGATVDSVEVPPVPEDVSYARFRDAARFFNYTATPTPGAPNVPPTNVSPIVRLRDVTPLDPGDGEPLQITVSTYDDSGIEAVFARYAIEGVGSGGYANEPLFDDGTHGDGLAGDGIFGVELPGLPQGRTLLLYVEGVDIDGVWDQDPGDPTDLDGLYRIPVGYQGPPVELSELMADNRTGPLDEQSEAEDWLELRNCGDAPISLGGMYFAKDFIHRDTWWELPPIGLGPGEHILFWFDRDPHQGPLHVPFHLEGTGDTVFLIGPEPTCGIVDTVSFGPLEADEVLGSLGCGEPWGPLSVATPGRPNTDSEPTFRRGDTNGDGRAGLVDVVGILRAVFVPGQGLGCPDSADVDDNGRLGLPDVIQLLLFIFSTGPSPAAPGLRCGTDPTPDPWTECHDPGC